MSNDALRKKAAKAELIRLTEPVIMRIAKACDGVGAGIAAYACASMTVVAWRKTGLSIARLHFLIDALAKTDAEKDAN